MQQASGARVEEARASPDKPRVQSAARALDILLVIAQGDVAGVTAKEVSNRLGTSRQVIYHLLHTLSAGGMVRRVSGTAYALGMGLAPIVEGFRQQLGSGMVIRFAEAAARATGETAYVVGWLDDEMVVLASIGGSMPIHAAEVPLGQARDAHARSSGKLLLSMLPAEAVEKYLARYPLVARTPHTIVTREALDAELERTRGQGFAVEREEFSMGLSCVSVPVGPAPGRIVLGVSAPRERFAENLDAYLAALRQVAASVGK